MSSWSTEAALSAPFGSLLSVRPRDPAPSATPSVRLGGLTRRVFGDAAVSLPAASGAGGDPEEVAAAARIPSVRGNFFTALFEWWRGPSPVPEPSATSPFAEGALSATGEAAAAPPSCAMAQLPSRPVSLLRATNPFADRSIPSASGAGASVQSCAVVRLPSREEAERIRAMTPDERRAHHARVVRSAYDLFFLLPAPPGSPRYTSAIIPSDTGSAHLDVSLSFLPGGLPPGNGKHSWGLFQHLHPTIQASASQVAFVAYMNGICVSPDEFINYGDAIAALLPQHVPIIGLYNPTHTPIPDGVIVAAETAAEPLSGIINSIIGVMRVFLETVALQLYGENSIHAPATFALVVHSEGGFILYRAFETLSAKIKGLIQRHLFIIALAPLHPIPNENGVGVVNIYSHEDYAVKPFLNTISDRSRYTIQILPSLAKAKEKVGTVIDHGFLSPTYQGALKNALARLAETHGIGSRMSTRSVFT